MDEYILLIIVLMIAIALKHRWELKHAKKRWNRHDRRRERFSH